VGRTATTTTTTAPTTTTTTPTPSCVQISEPLRYSYISANDACAKIITSVYFGNNISFASTTKISKNGGCTPSLGGWYSNGSIWKYTSDGINFISSGVCGLTTTTTTQQPYSLVYITNSSANAEIQSVVINGYSVTLAPITTPIPPSTSVSTVSYNYVEGNYNTVSVAILNGDVGKRIRIFDGETLFDVNCMTMYMIGTFTYALLNVPMTLGGNIRIYIEDQVC
jgi:hypothetical protein